MGPLLLRQLKDIVDDTQVCFTNCCHLDFSNSYRLNCANSMVQFESNCTLSKCTCAAHVTHTRVHSHMREGTNSFVEISRTLQSSCLTQKRDLYVWTLACREMCQPHKIRTRLYLLSICDTTLPYMWHDSLKRVARPTNLQMVSLRVKQFRHTCGKTSLHVWRDSFVYVTRLSRTRRWCRTRRRDHLCSSFSRRATPPHTHPIIRTPRRCTTRTRPCNLGWRRARRRRIVSSGLDMKIFVWMYLHVGVHVCNTLTYMFSMYGWVETYIPTNKQKHAHVHIYIFIYIYTHTQPWLILSAP